MNTTRLTLYVLISMVSAASAGIMDVDFSDARKTAAYALAIIATGLVTARSYIDQTPQTK